MTRTKLVTALAIVLSLLLSAGLAMSVGSDAEAQEIPAETFDGQYLTVRECPYHVAVTNLCNIVVEVEELPAGNPIETVLVYEDGTHRFAQCVDDGVSTFLCDIGVDVVFIPGSFVTEVGNRCAYTKDQYGRIHAIACVPSEIPTVTPGATPSAVPVPAFTG